MEAKKFELPKGAKITKKQKLHPVQLAIVRNKRQEEVQKMYVANHAINSSLPMHLKMQEYCFTGKKRLPGLPESNLGSELLKSNGVGFGFEDYLNYFPTEQQEQTISSKMEEELGIDLKTTL